jgi:putative hydrolase
LALLQLVPGIGRVQADRLHSLDIDTLEELENAAHDGRLKSLLGFGSKRVAAVVDSLATRLGRVRSQSTTPEHLRVEELLDVDREYRAGVRAGSLPMIAPRRFNPRGEAWLPILHTHHGNHHFTALFSNTALAHRLGRTHDWVILYLDGAGQQYTVVTSQHGPLKGKRIVRGREQECLEFYHSALAIRVPLKAREVPPDAKAVLVRSTGGAARDSGSGAAGDAIQERFD